MTNQTNCETPEATSKENGRLFFRLFTEMKTNTEEDPDPWQGVGVGVGWGGRRM